MRSHNPHRPPLNDQQFLSDPRDLQRLRDGVRQAQKIWPSPHWLRMAKSGQRLPISALTNNSNTEFAYTPTRSTTR